MTVPSRRDGESWNLASWFVDRHVQDGHGDRIAIRCGEDRVTYAELAALVNRTANLLAALGVQAGNRVLLAIADGVEFVAIWYAVQKLGAVTAECYTFLTPKDYAYFLDYTEATVVVADALTIESVRAASVLAGNPRRRILVLGLPDGCQDGEECFEQGVALASPVCEAQSVASSDVAIWKFTTGSTGAPKACVHTARSPFASFDAYARGVLDIGEDDVVLPVPKLFFGYARDLAALYPFGVGASGIVFPERATPKRIFELIARHRPTILVNVPTMMNAMIAHPTAAEQDLSSLRVCTSAGEALPSEVHRRWDELFGVEVLDGMGSSEAYHIYLSNRPGAVRSGTMGLPVPGYSARVVGDDLAELPAGEIGRLEITGPTVALGYFGDEERTAACFSSGRPVSGRPAAGRTAAGRSVSGRTVLSADLCRCDADGYYSYLGRADDLLKVSGIWVAPGEIEDCLLGHPDVLECAVAGYVIEGLTRPRAYVVARPGSAAGLGEELRAFARERLAGHKWPREIAIVEELPKTPNGKLDRAALRTSTNAEAPVP